jgi:Ca2+-binding EF-hand superfamily protein
VPTHYFIPCIDQVGALSDFAHSEEADFFIEALSRLKEFQSVPVPGKEVEEEDLLKEEMQISPQIGRVQFKFDRVKDVKADAELSKNLIEQKKAKKEEALKQNQHMGNPMQTLFDKFDTDGSGTLEFAEFEKACELMNLSFSKTELKMMFKDVDADFSGAIDLNEFTELMTSLRFKRMNMVQTGQWVETKGNKALTEAIYGGAHDWGAQMEWLNHSISKAGAIHQSANEQGVEVQGSNFEAFRKRLRNMFEDIDLDQSESLGVEELRRALNGFGLVLDSGTMSDFFASMDADGNGEIDYQEFEDTMLDLFFNRKNAGSENTPEWKKKFVQRLDSRLRPPPPERPKTVTSGCGSVKPTEDCSIQERHTMQYSYGKWEMATTTDDRPMDLVKIKINCTNIPQLMDKLKRKSAIPGFPCRPVVVLNVQDPETKMWFKVGQSDWLSGIVHPFEFCIECDYFKRLKEMELVAYDLEQGGHDADAMEHSGVNYRSFVMTYPRALLTMSSTAGTAMIGIETIWIPKRQEGSDITQKNKSKDVTGVLFEIVTAACLP